MKFCPLVHLSEHLLACLKARNSLAYLQVDASLKLIFAGVFMGSGHFRRRQLTCARQGASPSSNLRWLPRSTSARNGTPLTGWLWLPATSEETEGVWTPLFRGTSGTALWTSTCGPLFARHGANARIFPGEFGQTGGRTPLGCIRLFVSSGGCLKSKPVRCVVPRFLGSRTLR